jgi:hypothetical protein
MHKDGANERSDEPDLSLPPHMLPQLFELLSGGWMPDEAQQQAMEAHLYICSWCRVTLLYLLSVAEEADRQTGEDGAAAHALLERWVALHHRLEERGQHAPDNGTEGGASTPAC